MIKWGLGTFVDSDVNIMNKVRSTNIELLRIFAMLLIICFHYVYKSGYTFAFDNLTSTDYIIKTFYFFGELGVNLFILIMGYFLVKKKFSFKRLIKLILEVDFYYLLLLVIAYYFKIPIELTYNNFKDYFLIFFPAILDRYWFITAYLLLYCISPFLNVLLTKMKKEDLKRMILVCLLLWSLIPSCFGIFFNTTENLLYYNRFIWITIVYLIGGYIRLYSIKSFTKKRNVWLTVLITSFLMIMSMFFIHKYRYGFSALGTTQIAYFWTPNTILMIILSIAVFQIFIDLKIKNIKIINILASTTLGIYMLHDGIIARYLWDVIFKNKEHLMGPHPILAIVLSAIIIFTVGAIIDLIRQLLEKFTVKKILDSKTAQKIAINFNKVITKVEDLI